jgi:hypothetical protein
MDAIQASSEHASFPGVRGVFLLLPVLLLGCRANCDLVEAELRAKEAQLCELRQELGRRDCSIQALEMEIAQLQQRQCLQPVPGAPVPAGLVVKQIKLGRLTGGFDDDPVLPGDEGLQVLLEPRDCDDQSIKAPGSLHLEVFEITPQGLKVPLSTWDLSPAELRRKWDTPVFGGPAYRITLPWKSWPMTEKVRVVAQFTTLDGQRFEADKDVTVRLADNRPHVRRDVCPPGIVEPTGPHLPPPPPVEAPPSPPPPAAPMSRPPDPEPMTPPERPSEIAPASYVRPAAEAARPRPGAAPPVGLEPPVKARWTPVKR